MSGSRESAPSAAPIVVLDYGMGNIHSMVKALRLFADEVVYTNDPGAIQNCRALVLPGDGAFAAAMQNIAGDLQQQLLDFVAAGRPLLGVCIGFQILFEDSDEAISPEANSQDAGTATLLTRGLGVIPGRIRRFQFAPPAPEDGAAPVRVPHMGWNTLLYTGEAATQHTGDHMYFIHSYRAQDVPAANVIARCNYAGDVFPAIVKNDAGNVLATQFHPEKSDRPGLELIKEWVSALA